MNLCQKRKAQVVRQGEPEK